MVGSPGTSDLGLTLRFVLGQMLLVVDELRLDVPSRLYSSYTNLILRPYPVGRPQSELIIELVESRLEVETKRVRYSTNREHSSR